MTDIILSCRKCDLYKNQCPLTDRDMKAEIMLVGLSAKVKKFENEIPLDQRTRSGKLVARMDEVSRKYGYHTYRTNIVKCPPIGADGKLRYPEKGEIETCFDHVIREMESVNPRIVLMLGRLVADSMLEILKIDRKKGMEAGFRYYQYDGRILVVSYHPSYVLRSLRRTQDYMRQYEQMIVSLKGESLI